MIPNPIIPSEPMRGAVKTSEFVLVPRELTDEMYLAVAGARHFTAKIYEVLLEAAPKISVPEPQPEVAAEPVKGSRTTPAMRERLRELTKTDGRDDYDRCVLLLLDDYEAQIKANAQNLERYIPEYFSGTYSGMAKHPLGPWVRYDDPALTALAAPPVVDEAVKAENERLREALAYAHKGLDMVHNGLMDPSRPRQAVGEVCAHFLKAATDARSVTP